MGSKIGTSNIIDKYIGATNIAKTYQGSNLLWQKTPDILEMIRRNIFSGDDLSNKTLYMDFPNDLYSSLPTTNSTFLTTNVNKIFETIYWGEGDLEIQVDTGKVYSRYPNGTVYNISQIDVSAFNLGVVTAINDSNPAYRYIELEVPKTEIKTNIYEGTLLNGKTLYFSFPNNLAEQYNDTGEYTSIFMSGNTGTDTIEIHSVYGDSGSPAKKFCTTSIVLSNGGNPTTTTIYNQTEGELPTINFTTFDMPLVDYVVTDVVDYDYTYPYIKIKTPVYEISKIFEEEGSGEAYYLNEQAALYDLQNAGLCIFKFGSAIVYPEQGAVMVVPTRDLTNFVANYMLTLMTPTDVTINANDIVLYSVQSGGTNEEGLYVIYYDFVGKI